MGRIVCKFGGTSVADHNQFRQVKSIVESDPRRLIVVPSAPGKRHKEDPKVTDLLYLCHDTALQNVDFTPVFNQIRDRFIEIERELGIKAGMAAAFEQFKAQIKAGVSRDFMGSRGEYFNGLLMAAYLGAEFVDPEQFVIITPMGVVDPVSYDLLGKRLADERKKYVIPGFYGRDHYGQVKTFSRGGSDISGSIAARAARAELYENWTDVSGLLMADPRIVANPTDMDQITYREIRELSYMGASVFHDEAILPVREARIPINIKNTNKPNDPGTFIVPEFTHSKYKVAGIAGKKNFTMITVEKTLMNREIGFGYKVLGVLFSQGISFEHAPTSIDSMSIILDEKQLADRNKEELVVAEITRTVGPDSIVVSRDLALIAVVGEEFTTTVGLHAIGLDALRNAGVNVHLINMGASELNMIIGVRNADYEQAVRVLYEAYVKA